MQELTYASRCIVTTDEVADALLELVTAIDRREHSEAVAVPGFTDEGALVEAKMTLDASSEIVAVPDDREIPIDPETEERIAASVADIRRLIARNRSIPAPVALPIQGSTDLDFLDEI